jgi:alpha-L-rhamnosidase
MPCNAITSFSPGVRRNIWWIGIWVIGWKPDVQVDLNALLLMLPPRYAIIFVLQSWRELPIFSVFPKIVTSKIKVAFIKKFYNAKKGIFAKDSQTASALALYFHLHPKGEEAKIMAGLVDNIQIKWKGHLSVGLVGLYFLVHALSMFDHPEITYQVMTIPTHPGYGFMLKQGATTMWEDWDARSSLNHPMFGTVCSWFYDTLAGVSVDPYGPGFHRLFLQPSFQTPVTWVNFTTETMYGQVISNWKRTQRHITWDVQIPPNTNGTVTLKKIKRDSLRERDIQGDQIQGFTLFDSIGDKFKAELSPGKYHLEFDLI